MQDQSWYLYILRCNDGSYYVGITNNLEERVTEHNSGEGSKYTTTRRPVKLVYQEKHKNKSEARKREITIKGWTREKKAKLVAGFLHPDGNRDSG
ncbi:MAG: GIY-YIG nuclease family protein [Candidatus Brocadiia bacterium]